MFSPGKTPQKARRFEYPDHTNNFDRKTSVKLNIASVCRGIVAGDSPSAYSKDMIYYTVDPQFATLLYSVYSRNERLGVSILPDSFCFSAGLPSSSSILSYAHTVGLQLIALGEHYASFFTQVRTGSVIFLVGVGSLVCWKIWDYWNSGDEDEGQFQTSPPARDPSRKRFTKTPTKSAKEFFASFLEEEFVQDFNDFEDEDPALIQGKYFGPDSPNETQLHRLKTPEDNRIDSRNASEIHSPLTSQTDSGRQDLEDTSGAYLADDDAGSCTSDFEEDNLPFDGVSNPVGSERKRIKRRHHHHQRSSDRSNGNVMSRKHSHNANLYDEGAYRRHSSTFIQSERFKSKIDSLRYENDFSSSETSPREHHSRSETYGQKRQPSSRMFPDQKSDFENPEFELIKRQKVNRSTSEKKPYFYASFNSDEEFENEDRLQIEIDRETSPRSPRLRRSLSREISLNDLMGRLRQRSGQRPSISRDNSVSSRISDFLKRDDSICSNLSDFAFSECSEISLDFPSKDDSIADQTITSLADIEDELNTLKSSVLEIDEEFLKFASRPNPYLLKTTFTDYSYESSDSRPGSALDLITYRRSRSRSRSLSEDFNAIERTLNGSSLVTSEPLDVEAKDGQSSGDRNSKRSRLHSPQMKETVNFGSPQHEWTPSKRIRIQRRRSSIEASLRFCSQEEGIPSLEWDNGCFKQYEEDKKIPEENSNFEMEETQIESIQEIKGFEEFKTDCKRHTFLPSHCSLELDLEKELQSFDEDVPTFHGREVFASPSEANVDNSSFAQHPFPDPNEFLNGNCDYGHSEKNIISKMFTPPSLNLEPSSEAKNAMTTSVDSAILSAPCSRSGSSSPVPHSLTQSMMSSGIGASWSESFERSQEGEVQKSRKFWANDESGYVEGDNGMTASTASLSPVQEVRENENSLVVSLDNHNNNNNNTNNNISPQSIPYGSEETSDISYEINGNNSDNNLNIMGNNESSLNGESPAASINNRRLPLAVGEKINILSYAETEWQGNTKKAHTIKRGYCAIPSELNLHNLRRIRGDNYCGIRAVLYQILSSGLPIPNGYQTYTRLVSEVNRGAHWLNEYSFGRRLSYSKEQVQVGFKECLDALDKLNSEMSGCVNKEAVLVSRLNRDSDLDVKLCEAAKLHMLACALDLHKKEAEGGHIPLFGMIMYARQSCLTPRDFVVNHLNAVGDSAGLEQIEMFLLGHSLRLTLQVVRPSCHGSEDFICFYPDENIGVWPEVNLVAEDDRHYNVLVK